MGRRVFLSVLGVAFYETCRYRKDDFTGSETLFVQKSLLEYLQQQENWGGENDLVLMLLTGTRIWRLVSVPSFRRR